jgi:hypothetical protein
MLCHLLEPDSNLKSHNVSSAEVRDCAAGLEEAVLLLPRIVPRLHDTGVNAGPGENPLAWGVPALVQQVEALVRRAGLTTLPSLEEWALLPDKVSPFACLTPMRLLHPCQARHHPYRGLHLAGDMWIDACGESTFQGSCACTLLGHYHVLIEGKAVGRP